MSASRGRRRAATTAIGATLLAGALTGCGADEAPEVSSTAPAAEGIGEVTVAADGVQEVTIQTQDDYVFTPDHVTVAPGTVRLTVVNVAEDMVHNLEFTDAELPQPITAGISLLTAGQRETIEFEVATPGDHPFACTFHQQLGHVGTMTVSG